MRKQITAFYLEALLLVAVFTAVLLVLAGVFSSAKQQSVQARRLTQAVLLAENAAEAVAASDSMETLQSLLSADGAVQQNGNVFTVWENSYQVDITWEPGDTVADSRITVSRDGEAIYTLETAVCLREAAK